MSRASVTTTRRRFLRAHDRVVPSSSSRGDGRGVVSHAGSRLLADLADVTGLTSVFTDALRRLRPYGTGHDPSRIAVDLAVMPGKSPGCKPTRPEVAHLRPVPADATCPARSWTSTPPWSPATPRRNRRRPPVNAASATTRCCASWTTPAKALAGLLRPGNAGANTVTATATAT
ncbi:mobile element protein [Streptomyces sp. L-9-10]|nr:mobile element protein [Streptomyces sp. L-9-10]